jgi:hypothetical protein
MRNKSEKKIIDLIREQYENIIYSTLLEMDATAAGGKILVDAGLEVTNIKTGEKFTIQSVQKNGSNVTVSIISPENITGPITSGNGTTVVAAGQHPQIYSIEDFEKNFKV